jgi:hypothetical protein
LGYTSGHFPEECSKFIGPKFDGDVVSRQLWSTISFSSVNGSQKNNWSILRWPDRLFYAEKSMRFDKKESQCRENIRSTSHGGAHMRPITV